MAQRPNLKLFIFAVTLLATPLGPATAVEPSEMLADPVKEARARELSKGLRCLVCRNQSIDDSNAGLARDLRVLLRERLTAGDTDEQAMQYLVDRYGQYILLEPPFQVSTYLLWISPILFFSLGVGGFYFWWRKPPVTSSASDEISDEDRALLNDLLAVKDTT